MTTVTIRLDSELKSRLDDLAREHGNQSEAIRHLIMNAGADEIPDSAKILGELDRVTKALGRLLWLLEDAGVINDVGLKEAEVCQQP